MDNDAISNSFVAAMAGDQLESLLSGFFEDFKSGVLEIQTLKSNRDAEFKKREALQLAIESLQQENKRLSRLYTESLNNLVDQVEHRTTCQSLKKRIKEDEEEHKVAMESMKQEYTRKIEDSEARIRSLQVEKETAEATVNHLHRDLEAHKSHIQHLATRLNQLNLTVESRYELEIEELKNHIAAEQEEKNELNKRLQHLEKELLICRSKPVKQPKILTSGVLQRKEIRVLKRKHDSEGN